MYFDDFAINQQFTLAPVSLTEEEIYEFAEKFDPQPIHVDEEFANNSIFKGIIASGFHTMGIIWGEWIRANIIGREIISGIGMDYTNWKAPVRANDQLRTVVEVVDKIPSSKGPRGIVVFKFTVTNQEETVVLDTQARVIVKARS